MSTPTSVWLTRGTLRVFSGCAQGALRVRSGYAQGALRVRSGCAQGTLRVRSGYAQGTLRVCSGPYCKNKNFYVLKLTIVTRNVRVPS